MVQEIDIRSPLQLWYKTIESVLTKLSELLTTTLMRRPIRNCSVIHESPNTTKFIFWLALEGDLQTVGYSEWIRMNVWKTSQNSKLVDNLQQGISTGFQLFKNVESKIRQKSSKSGHNTPGNMTPSQVSPTHEPMSTDDSKSRGSHGTPTSPTKSMGSNKSVGTKEESYRHWFGIIFVKKFFSISNL